MTIKNRNKRDILYSYQETLIKEREDGNIFEEINSLINIGDILNKSNNIYENKLFYNIIFKNRLPIFDFNCNSSTSCCTTFNVNISSSDVYRIKNMTKKNYSEFCQVGKDFLENYSKGKLTKKNIINNKLYLFIEMQYQDDSKKCIFLKNSLCSINDFKPQTCINFPLGTTRDKIIYGHKKFLEQRCNYTLKENNSNINNYIKDVFFHSYLFNIDCFIALELRRYTKTYKKILKSDEIIEFFVSKFLDIQEIEKIFLSKIQNIYINYIVTNYDLNNECKIFEIISDENITQDIKEKLTDLNVKKYNNELKFEFKGLKIKVIFSNKLSKIFGKNLLYSKEEYLYHIEKNIIENISIDVAYRVSDNLYNLIYFAIKQKDINSINQYIKDFELLNNKFQNKKILLNFIKIIKKLYFNSILIDKKTLKEKINDFIEKFGDNDYYIKILQIHINYIDKKDINKLLNEINLLVSNFKDKELKIYKYIIKNKLDIYPINNYLYEKLNLIENINKDDIFNILDSLNKENLNISNIDILFDKLNYYLASNNYQKSNQIIYNIDNSFDSLLRIADIYLSNDLLESSFLYLQKCLDLTDDKFFLQELSLNIIIDLYIKSNNQLDILYYILDDENKNKFNKIIKNNFEKDVLINYINYKNSKNIELLKNLRLKYFYLDKKTSFLEIIKKLAENLSFEYIINNNIEPKYIFIDAEDSYLNSLIQISKGNLIQNNKLNKIIELYNNENYKLIDEFVLGL